MKNSTARKVAFGGLIAALYVALTYIANLFGLASGAIQVRVSEALTILRSNLLSEVDKLLFSSRLREVIAET